MKKLLGTLFDKTFLKYLAVGCFNTLFGSAIMFTAYNLLHLPYTISVGANYVIGSIVSYFLNKRFTFGRKGRSPRTALRFALNIAVCCVIAYGVARPLTHSLLSGVGQSVQDNGAMLVGMVLFVMLNYIGQRFFTVRDSEKQN